MIRHDMHSLDFTLEHPSWTMSMREGSQPIHVLPRQMCGSKGMQAQPQGMGGEPQACSTCLIAINSISPAHPPLRVCALCPPTAFIASSRVTRVTLVLPQELLRLRVAASAQEQTGLFGVAAASQLPPLNHPHFHCRLHMTPSHLLISFVTAVLGIGIAPLLRHHVSIDAIVQHQAAGLTPSMVCSSLRLFNVHPAG